MSLLNYHCRIRVVGAGALVTMRAGVLGRKQCLDNYDCL